MGKKIIYIDLDNTMADYLLEVKRRNSNVKDAKHIHGFFSSLQPMSGAIDAYNELSKYFQIYFLTTSPWSNPQAASEKISWVKQYIPNAYKNVIITHRKDLNIGSYLIDDSDKNGAGDFSGKFIHFRTDEFPDWTTVVNYIKNREKIE